MLLRRWLVLGRLALRAHCSCLHKSGMTPKYLKVHSTLACCGLQTEPGGLSPVLCYKGECVVSAGEGLSESDGYIPFNKLVIAFKVSFSDAKLKYAFANRGFHFFPISSVQFSHSVVSDSLLPHGPHSMPGLPVHHQLPEFTQTHVH